MDMNVNVIRDYKSIEPRKGIIYLFFKRAMDIVGSAIGLILLSPLFILVALAIKIEDPKGKVFFAQKKMWKR